VPLLYILALGCPIVITAFPFGNTINNCFKQHLAAEQIILQINRLPGFQEDKTDKQAKKIDTPLFTRFT